MNYDQWFKKVESLFEKRIGHKPDDFFGWPEMFDEGLTPSEAIDREIEWRENDIN